MTGIDLRDETIAVQVRFGAALSEALELLTAATAIVDEEGPLNPAAQAASEAARASIIAMGRAELADAWWAGRVPDPSEVFVEKTSAEEIGDAWAEAGGFR